MESRGESRGAEPKVITETCAAGLPDATGTTPRFWEELLMTRMSTTRQIVISAVVLAGASTVTGLVMMVSGSTSPGMVGMAGMDHGSAETSSSSPTVADAGGMPGMDMPGMDSGTGDATEGGPPPTPSGDMPGMDMSGMDMSGSAPTTAPEDHGEMPGMDMSGSTPTPTTTMDPEMPGMDMPGGSHDEHGEGTEAVVDRPLLPVLGTFGGGSAAVLLTAGMLRRKDRAATLAKKAARASGRAHK
jgi:hypothetical protein